MKPIERLQALEAEGVALSRNQNFDRFEDPDERRALALHRYLEALADEIRTGWARGAIEVHLAPGGDGRVGLHLHRTDLAARHVARLDPEELRALAARREVGEVLAACGVDLEAAAP